MENELNPMLDAFAYAEDLAEKAVNQLLLPSGTATELEALHNTKMTTILLYTARVHIETIL